MPGRLPPGSITPSCPRGRWRRWTKRALAVLLEQKAALGVPVLRLNAYSAGDPAIVGPAADDERTRTYASVLMKKAAALGVETIGVGAPKARTLPEGYDRRWPVASSPAFCASRRRKPRPTASRF